jgi:hypothetical protein
MNYFPKKTILLLISFLFFNLSINAASASGLYLERINLSQKEKQIQKEQAENAKNPDAKASKKFNLADYVQFGAIHKHKKPEMNQNDNSNN